MELPVHDTYDEDFPLRYVFSDIIIPQPSLHFFPETVWQYDIIILVLSGGGPF